MQAYKLKGMINQSGHLVVTEPIKMTPGEVEVIILQPVPAAEDSPVSVTGAPAETPSRKRPSKIKSLQDWFAKTAPASPDFDPDRARWEAMQEKHSL